MDEEEVPRCCWLIILVIIILVIVGSIIILIMWDSDSKPSPPPSLPPSITADAFTFSQHLSTTPNQSRQSQVKTTDGSILGDVRQVFLPPPTQQPSRVLITDGKLRYEYNGSGANGFEVRWLDYVTTDTSSIKSVDLSDLERFTVDISSIKFTNNANTFTLQLNVKDEEGLESSVVDVLNSSKVVSFDKSSFIGNKPGQVPDFSKITGIWLGGDFRTSGGNVTLGPLMFVRRN